MKTPKVSIITANHNCEKFIKETIESVQAQSFTQWEMIIVDDNSEDKGIEIIKEFCTKDDRIQLIQNTSNLGAAKTRNKAIEIAQGRYIAFLDSDDIWEEQKLERQINYMEENKFPFTYTSYKLIDEESQAMGEYLVKGKVCYQDLLKTCSIGCLTVVYDTQVLGKVLMPDILKRQDYGLWLRLLKKTEFAYAMDESLAFYRIRKNSISSNKRKAAVYQWKIYREVENLNIFTSIYYFLNYAINGFIKYRK